MLWWRRNKLILLLRWGASTEIAWGGQIILIQTSSRKKSKVQTYVMDCCVVGYYFVIWIFKHFRDVFVTICSLIKGGLLYSNIYRERDSNIVFGCEIWLMRERENRKSTLKEKSNVSTSTSFVLNKHTKAKQGSIVLT